MQVYIFSSNSLTNIWAGIGARMWAVSETQANNLALAGRAQNLPLVPSGCSTASKPSHSPFRSLSGQGRNLMLW